MATITDEITDYVSFLYDTFSVHKNVEISPRDLRNKMLKADAVRFIWLSSELSLTKEMTMNIFKDIFGCRFKLLVDNMYHILSNIRRYKSLEVPGWQPPKSDNIINIKDIIGHYRSEQLSIMIDHLNSNYNVTICIPKKK